jgi:hypothetical protein
MVTASDSFIRKNDSLGRMQTEQRKASYIKRSFIGNRISFNCICMFGDYSFDIITILFLGNYTF